MVVGGVGRWGGGVGRYVEGGGGRYVGVGGGGGGGVRYVGARYVGGLVFFGGVGS